MTGTSLSRRRLVRTLGAVGGLSIGTAGTVSAKTSVRPLPVDATSSETEQYVAVVDRIVDGEFVVLLLEADGKQVDQHVEPASEMDVDEGDILQVVIKDDAVLAYQRLSKRPGEPADADRGC